MRGPIIILVLVALSFVAVLVYGVGRDRPEAGPEKPAECGSPPPKIGKDKDDAADALEDWKPPCVLQKLESFAGSRTKGIKIEQPEVRLSGSNATDTRRASPAKDPGEDTPRMVKLELTSGTAARIVAVGGGDKQTLCLCRPGASLLNDDVAGCNSGWLKKQAGVCQPDSDRGALTFGGTGGTLTFSAFQPAVVVAK